MPFGLKVNSPPADDLLMASQSSDPFSTTDALTDRLAAHLRSTTDAAAGLFDADDEGLFDAQPEQALTVPQQPNPAHTIVHAEHEAQTARFNSGPTVSQSHGEYPLPNEVTPPRHGRSPASMIRTLAATSNDGQRARLHEATSVPVPDDHAPQPVDPSKLPPPVRKGFSIASPVRVNPASNGPVVVKQASKRAVKRQVKAARQQAEAAQRAHDAMPPAQILDQRVPGNYREDSAFLVPLIPAMLVAAGGTYLWFQGAIRLMSLLPLTPIIMGVMIGGIMRMGSRTVDFARIIFAVMITGFATFWGHAAITNFGPLNELSKTKILWGDLPRVNDTTVIISLFRDLAEQSLGTAAIMFGGFVAAGMVSSVRAK